jgi:hypothetical protein
MSSFTQENSWARRTKWLTQALIISGTLNIGFVATFAYFVLKERQGNFVLELKPTFKELAAKDTLPTNVQLLRSYSVLPYQELILRLENKELAEEGLAKRDLALACLTAFYHFNLDKALGGLPVQKKNVSFTNYEGQETIQLPVFPGLADYQFSAILQYAKTEKWPLTSQGLFNELKRSPEIHDPSLLAAFHLSPEYHSAYTLLTKSGLNLSREQVIELIIEGDWRLLTELNAQQRVALDLSPDKRRSFLLDYLKHHSKRAARILIENDLDFIAKRCNDTQVLTLLDLYSEYSPSLEQFTKELLASPRTEAVCRKAASLLYSWAKEEWKEPYDHLAAIQRFCPQQIATQAPIPKEEPLITPVKAALQTQKPDPSSSPQAPRKKMHTIEPGDNLWKIARKYHVSVEELMKTNRMETEKLRPGRQLEIPEKKQAVR